MSKTKEEIKLEEANTTTKAELLTAKGEVATAEKKLANAKEELVKAKEELVKAEKKLANAKEELVKAKEELVKAKASGDEDEIKAARAAVSRAEAGANTAQAGVDTAQAGVDTAQEGVGTAQVWLTARTKSLAQVHTSTSSVIHDATFNPRWTSFLLALGSDVAVYIPPTPAPPTSSTSSTATTSATTSSPPAASYSSSSSSSSASPPLFGPTPNVLRLHLATTQNHWPTTNLDGTPLHPPLPAPLVYGEHPTANPGSRIYIRPQYVHILPELERARTENSTEFGGSKPSKGAIVAGNSGIGKSMLLLYRIHQLLQPVSGKPRPTIVFYHQSRNKILVVRMQGVEAPDGGGPPPRLALENINYSMSLQSFETDLEDPNVHLLIDLRGKEAIPKYLPSTGQCFILVALSPGLLQSLNQWIKKEVGFSLSEVEECRRLIFPPTSVGMLAGETVRRLFISDDRLSQRYELYGGIARSLFDKSEEHLTEDLANALDTCSLDDIISDDGKLTGLSVESSMLLHYQVFVSPPLSDNSRRAVLDALLTKHLFPDFVATAPTPHPTLPFRLLNPPVEVPTSKMRELVYRHAKAKDNEWVTRFLKSCIGHPKLAKVRGDIFEPHAHEIMRHSPTVWFQRLDPDGGGVVGPLFHRKLPVDTCLDLIPIRKPEDIGKLEIHQYGQPVKENFPTLDAVIHPNISLQFTVSPEHNVLSQGLYHAEQHLNRASAARPALSFLDPPPPSLFSAVASLAAAATVAAVTSATALASAGQASAASVAQAPTASVAHAPTVPVTRAAGSFFGRAKDPARSLRGVGGFTGAAACTLTSPPPFRMNHFFCVPRDRFTHFRLLPGNFILSGGFPLPSNVDYWLLVVEDTMTAARNGPPPKPGPGACGCSGKCMRGCPCALCDPPVKCGDICNCKSDECANR